MTPKEYLSQARRIDERIKIEIEEAGRLREMAASIQSPRYGEGKPSKRTGEAAFARRIDSVIDLEESIRRKIDRLVALKGQIHETIDALKNADEQMVLRYRYLKNYGWDEIANKLHVSNKTAVRWHNKALSHVRRSRQSNSGVIKKAMASANAGAVFVGET